MIDVFEATLPLQMMLVAGYAGLMVSDIGRGANRAAHDAVFRVLAFGLAAEVPLRVLRGRMDIEAFSVPFEATAIVLCGLALGALWRVVGRRGMSWAMKVLGIYRDDHEATALASILAVGKPISTLQICRDDGRWFECHIDDLPTNLHGHLSINEDGIAMCVTSYKRADGTLVQVDRGQDDFSEIDYFPSSRIRQITFALVD
jgi:hypothetical protein